MSLVSIIPLEKFVKWFIIDKCSKIFPNELPTKLDAQPIRKRKKRVPKVIVAAMIWFSVKEEAKIPNEIKAVPIRKRPR
jgi:hypothetical protein